MPKTFLITSHTENGPYIEKRIILNGLVKSLKKYFPDCFVLISSSCEVEIETQAIADFVIVDKKTINQPHGQGELILTKLAVDVFKKFGFQDFYKLVYDFIIDDSNFTVFDKWISENKSFVSCYWKTQGLGVGTWAYYSKIDIFEKIFSFDVVDKFIEWKVLESIQSHNLEDQCQIYSSHLDLFNGDWSKCDLVNNGGFQLKYNYGSVVAVVYLDDKNEYDALFTIRSIIEQHKTPNHLLIVDNRTVKHDIREIPVFSKLFDLMSQKYISWNLIFYFNEKNIFDHLVDLNHTWCWILNDGTLLDKNALYNLYTNIIFNLNIGYIKNNSNLLYRNKIVESTNENINLINFVVDEMNKTNYTNIVN